MANDAGRTAVSDAERGRAADELFDHFEHLIRSGALKEGQTLPTEREIVETHGVSRTVVREALRQLASRGLILARPRFRPVVRLATFDVALETTEALISQLLATPEDVRHLYETRILLEASLARYAASHATDDQITGLKAALDENGAAVAENELFFQTDIGFHEVLYRIQNNPILMALHRGYATWLAPQWAAMARDESRNTRNFIAHRAVYDAVERRDPDAAEAALRNHLEEAWLQVCETFETV